MSDLSRTLVECLSRVMFALETASDNDVDPDFSVALMEMVGADLNKLTSADAALFREYLSAVSSTADSREQRMFVDTFAQSFGLTDKNTEEQEYER